MDELWRLSASELQARIKRREISVEALTRYYLQRIEKYNPKLNAVCEINPSAIEQARRLDAQKTDRDQILFGMPVLVKDNIDVAGLHTSAGSLALADNMAHTNAQVVENMIRRGAVILGKTNMTEFANFTSKGMPNGYSSKGGQVVNAYDPKKDPGGSSTGSAVAVSAGLCALAVGTDTSFSVIGCATDNGVAGFKPAHSALSSRGIIPISSTLDSAGAFGKSLSDAVMLYNGMRETPIDHIKPALIRDLHIGINLHNREMVSDVQLRYYDRLLDALRRDGAMIEEMKQPHTRHLINIMLCEFKRDLERYLSHSAARYKTLEEIVACYQADPERMMPYGISILQDADTKSIEDSAYTEAMTERARLKEQIVQEIEQYDACLMTGPTNIMHFTGLPSLALNMAVTDSGIPRGVILYGADERRLLSAALTIENYCTPYCPPSL